MMIEHTKTKKPKHNEAGRLTCVTACCLPAAEQPSLLLFMLQHVLTIIANTRGQLG